MHFSHGLLSVVSKNQCVSFIVVLFHRAIVSFFFFSQFISFFVVCFVLAAAFSQCVLNKILSIWSSFFLLLSFLLPQSGVLFSSLVCSAIAVCIDCIHELRLGLFASAGAHYQVYGFLCLDLNNCRIIIVKMNIIKSGRQEARDNHNSSRTCTLRSTDGPRRERERRQR